MINDWPHAFFDTAIRLDGLPGGPLSGLRFAAKDLFDVAGHTTGAGNPHWWRSHAPATTTADCIMRLTAAGATLVGKTHTDELAFSLEGANQHYGTPRNPACPGRLPGGSSSGSAVAVAAALVDFAIGTDTGGSVRVPAAFCGVHGFRPTHGVINPAGTVALAPSYDTVGWFAGTARLLARVGAALLPADSAAPRDRPLLFDPALFAAVDAPVREAMEDRVLGLTGVTRIDTGLAGLDAQHECYRRTQGAELWREHGAWIRGISPVFGTAIAPRFADAAAITPEQEAPARAARADYAQRLDRILEYGMLLMPAAPTIALPLDADGGMLGDFYRRALGLGAVAGFAGAPQVVVPAGRVSGCPIGLSLIGPRGADHQLLAWACSDAAASLNFH